MPDNNKAIPLAPRTLRQEDCCKSQVSQAYITRCCLVPTKILKRERKEKKKSLLLGRGLKESIVSQQVLGVGAI